MHWLVCVLLWAACWPVSAAAQDRAVGRPLAVCLAKAAPGVTLRSLATRPGIADCTTPQTAFGPGDFWAVSAPVDRLSTAAAPLRIRTGSIWQDRVTLHVVHRDGHVATQTADVHAMSRHIQLGAVIEFAVAPHPSPVARVIWQVKGAANMRGVVVGARVATEDQSARANLWLAALYATFGGLCAALLVYNLALWTALRHRFQLAYCALVGCLMLYALTSSGALAWAWPGIANTQRITLNYVLLCLAAAAALAFSRSFFEPRVFDGWLGRLTDAMIVVMLGLGGTIAVAAPFAIRVLDPLFSAAFIALLLVVMPILWRGWQRRSNYLWLFALAWAAPLVMTAARLAQNMGWLRWSFWLDNSTLIAMTVEALVTSLAIAYRIRLLSHERDAAIRQEIVTRRLADTDPLTGLLNRRAFLSQAIGRVGTQRLLIVDIDHFKRVNEAIGHDGGDEVLRLFARALRRAAPAALIARIGGEEFAMLSDAARPIDIERLLASLRSERMPFDLTVTASIGVCDGPIAREADWKRLYRHADGALFDAKADGRDQARFATAMAHAA